MSQAGILHRELELKAVVPDPAALARRIEQAGGRLLFRGTMEDRRYDRDGELASSDLVLRTRVMVSDAGQAEAILGWKGPTRRSAEGYKLRDELEYRVQEGSPGPLLLALGYEVVHVISRRIHTWKLGDATVRIEQYPRMDTLVEIEGSPAAIEAAIRASGIPRASFVADTLTDFVARYEERTGQRAVVGVS